MLSRVKNDTSYLDLNVRTRYHNRPAKSAETASVSAQEAEAVTEGERDSTERAGVDSTSVCLSLGYSSTGSLLGQKF